MCSPLSNPPRASASGINDLADTNMTEIFKNLPPFDRLRVSEVCRRWRDLSRMAWLDINHLDLSSIPGPNMRAIVELCPNLQSVFALRKTYGINELHCLSVVNLRSVKLFECKALIPRTDERVTDAFSAFFSDNLQSAAWDELVLHDFGFKGASWDRIEFPATFPGSLKRLQLTGNYYGAPPLRLPYRPWMPDPNAIFLRGLEELQSLECLILLEGPDCGWAVLEKLDITVDLAKLQNLRELCFGPMSWHHRIVPAHSLQPTNMPKLEVLFLPDAHWLVLDKFLQLIPTLTALRILVITGRMSKRYVIPTRKRFPKGFDATPLPLLHVFVGVDVDNHVSFTPPLDALKVYCIDEPLPQFLEREYIKPIFEGVWIAKMIKAAAIEGFTLNDSWE